MVSRRTGKSIGTITIKEGDIKSVTSVDIKIAEPLEEKVVPVKLPVGFNGNWTSNYNKGKKIALKHNVPMLILFNAANEDSEKLEAEVFSREKFKLWATATVVLVKIDFAKENIRASLLKKMEALKEFYAVDELPVV